MKFTVNLSANLSRSYNKTYYDVEAECATDAAELVYQQLCDETDEQWDCVEIDVDNPYTGINEGRTVYMPSHSR